MGNAAKEQEIVLLRGVFVHQRAENYDEIPPWQILFVHV